MSVNSDEKLIASYLTGDEKSLETLIKRYLKSICSFIYRYIGNRQEAEDITQEVFVRVWRNLKKPALSLSKGFDPKKGKFKTWIFSIAKNASIDFLKRKKAIPFSEFENEKGKNTLIETLINPAPLPDKLFEQSNVGEILNTAMNHLTPKYRMVLFLRYNDHFTFREIAEALGEPLNTIKSRHRRAIILLKKLLTES